MPRPSLALVPRTEPAHRIDDTLIRSLEELGLFSGEQPTEIRAVAQTVGATSSGWQATESRRGIISGFWSRRPARDGEEDETRRLPEISVNSDTVPTFIRALGTQPDIRLVEDLKSAFGANVEHEPSQDGTFHRLTFRDLVIQAGDQRLSRLDFSGITANVALRFENCRFDALDFSYATLHSIRIIGCEPAPKSPLHPYGMRILADGLLLNGDFYIERGRSPTRILTLHGEGVRAREVQFLNETEFNGGKLAAEIWRRLLENHLRKRWFGLSEAGASEVERQIDIHMVAARGFLKTIDLRSLNADLVILAAKCEGIVDLHDAKIERRLLIVGDAKSSYHPVDFYALSEDFLARTLLGGSKISAKKRVKASIQSLSGRYSPSLDLSGVTVRGEIRFDGPQDDSGPPPVTGIVNLANASCRVFTDDHRWLNMAKAKGKSDSKLLGFDLGCFEYQFFGLSPRYLFDEDRQSRRFRSRLYQAPEDPAESAIERERERHDELERYLDASVKIVEVERKELVAAKIRWLEAAGEEGTDSFDAQPWTHCAGVMRRAGWRDKADEVLLVRERRVRSSKCGAKLLAFAIAIVLILRAWIEFFQAPDDFGIWLLLLSAISSVVAYVGKRFGYFQALLDSSLDVTIGFGYKPGRALAQSVLIIFCAAVAFWCFRQEHLLMPNPGAIKDAATQHRKSAPTEQAPAPRAASLGGWQVNDTGLTLISARDYRDCGGYDRLECCLDPLPRPATPVDPRDCKDPPKSPNGDASGDPEPQFNALMYSLDVFVPLIDFSQGSFWIPGREHPKSRQPGVSDHVRDLPVESVWLVYWFLVAAGWWYSSVLVATVTGFLDRKE